MKVSRMMEENGSEGSQVLKRSVSYQDRPEKEQKQPFKKRARFLYSDDIMEVGPSENSDVTDDGRRIRDTTEEIKAEITPIKKSSYGIIYRKDVLVASISQLEISEGDRQEEEQKASMEDGGNGNNSNNTPGEKEQNKGGKKLMEYTTSTIVHDGGSRGKTPENALDCSVTAPNVDSMNIDANSEGDHHVVEDGHNGNGSDQCATGGREQNIKGNEPAEFFVSTMIHDRCSVSNIGENVVANNGDCSGNEPDVVDDDPMTIIDGRKRNRSSHELGDGSGGDESGQQARKKFRSDEISESSYDEQLSVVQHGNHTFRLFGIDIPYEEEHQNTKEDGGSSSNPAPRVFASDGSSSVQQPIFGFRLFGVDIPGEHIPPAAMGIEDGENGNNLVPASNGGSHGSGDQSSMQQPPKAGFRLFGFDI
ncbi:hypothetical protein L6452_16670 [Arctium lappa]|uniref:Uncharacterized protein n=1 Tax=Arctium lappa TaxID=4217 RepID=A0ACB9C1H1_ARCLA|nr:hypothetical protein L6452_16670 [Arctium lappa]